MPSIQNAEDDGLAVGGALALQAEADGVLAIELDAALGFDGAEIDAADSLVLEGELDFQGLGQRVGADGACGDPAGGGEIAIHQRGRDGEDVADVVEAVAEIVGGEALFGAEFDGQQIADGVGVLAAVEAAGGDAAGIGLEVAVGLLELLLQVLEDGIHLRGARHAFGRHLAGADLAHDDVPAIAALSERRGLGELRDIHPAGCEVFVVAGSAGFGEDGDDCLFEGRGIGGQQGTASGHK